MKISFPRVWFSIFVLILSISSVVAQRGAASVYALTNARLMTVSGATIERGTIVIRNGLIERVGANVQIPADARVIDATGLTVYPGIFDANTNLGIAARQQQAAASPFQAIAAPQPSPAANQPQSNSVYPVGLQPEVSAAELIRASDAGFETARNNGFTTVLTAPRERLFVGQAALINTAGESAAAMILRSDAALQIQFQPLQGGAYPTSLMGAFSAVRQMFLDAARLQTARESYEKNQRGVRRPEANKSLEALIPVLRREIPVVFVANTEREIVRALDLTQEFNLRSMISGGNEAYKVAARLKAQNVPVLLSLNFPRRTASNSPEADPETIDVLRLRVETPKNPARLKQVGVKFAFTSGAATNLSDFYTNANKAVENGLTKDAALRAMTLDAAEIFGVSNQLGSLETGKIANLTVTRGDIFDKSRTFTHVFVDGQMFEIRQAAAPPTTQNPVAGNNLNLAGTWTLSVEIPGRPTQITLNLTQQGNRLGGAVQSPFGNSEITSGDVTGDNFTFKTVLTFGQTYDVTFSGRVTGSQMTGTATTPQGTIPFTGSKNP